ncbi:MAG: ornithine carbamoyltransferase [Hyphomonadaceae bacterium]|nr:ornithine carbamoyltransferase [Hyphomonadaceae bacterium]
MTAHPAPAHVRHFLDLAPLPAGELRALVDAAHRRKADRGPWFRGQADADAPLKGAVLAMIFQKASTRTRVSFDIAMRQVGGSSIVMSAADMQLGRGETIEDTAKVLSRMVDCVMIRANRHEDVVNFAGAASVPVINGLTDLSHPCQIVADIMTIEERIGEVAGKRIAWIGDGNNVCASFLQAAAKLDYSMAIATPKDYAPRTQEIEAARKAGAKIDVCATAMQAAQGADVVVTDTWVSMGDVDKDARMAAFPAYCVTDKVMAEAKPAAVFLHCLPAHRGEEVSEAVMDGAQSAVWDEAENRIHAQKAVLLWSLGYL